MRLSRTSKFSRSCSFISSPTTPIAARTLDGAGCVSSRAIFARISAQSRPAARNEFVVAEKISFCAVSKAWANWGLRIQRFSVAVEIATLCAASSSDEHRSTAVTASGNFARNRAEILRDGVIPDHLGSFLLSFLYHARRSRWLFFRLTPPCTRCSR